MKKNIGFGLVLILSGIFSNSFAQRPNRPMIREKIENQQIAFITRHVELTTEEAKLFWPVYNEFGQKKKALNKEFAPKVKPDIQDKLSEAQYKEITDSQLLREQKLLDLKKEYHSRFLSILPASKVFKLYQADREFKKVLLKKLGEQRRKGKMPPEPMPGDE